MLRTSKKETCHYKNEIKISGNVSGLSGNVSGLSGNVSGVSGNINDCEITEEERKNGIEITDLIKESDGNGNIDKK